MVYGTTLQTKFLDLYALITERAVFFFRAAAAMTPGGTSFEATQLNIESLWSGGPFADETYNGGNPVASAQGVLADDMQTIRETIFESSIGEIENIDVLTTDAGAYGSYAGAGYLLTTLATSGNVTDYFRWLDMDQAVAHATWSQSKTTFTRAAAVLPVTTYAFSPFLETGLPTPNVTCLDNATLVVRGLVSEPGMLYEIIGRAQATPSNGKVLIQCKPAPSITNGLKNATITISGAAATWFSWVGGTNYDLEAGDAAHNFTFQGSDPHATLLIELQGTSQPTYQSLLSSHTSDYDSVISPFKLNIGQIPNFSIPTDELRNAYQTDEGDPYLEWLLFNLGRYMLASSARGALPANLQGKWLNDIGGPWSADYHANINLQMNYWIAEMTGMDVTSSLFDYMQSTWAPRGAQTAQFLYNISRGWVTHDEMNIFGHTGMKAEPGSNPAQWADYPGEICSVDDDPRMGSFRLHKRRGLVEGSRLASGEGCAHAQQLIWQLFNTIEKGFQAAEDTDTAFLEEVLQKRAQMDKGIRIGSWGQLQEWKVEKDQQADTHRHLSHLVGLYPGYALSSYDASVQGGLVSNGTYLNYTKSQVIEAAEISLIHRGDGTGPDGNAGWEKVWRAACWAQLGNSTAYYHQLTYAIATNFASNLFSLYNAYSLTDTGPLFQIDANLGYPAAVLNALLQAPDVASQSAALTITLLPAVPKKWASGSITGARIRGGISINMTWSNSKLQTAQFVADSSAVGKSVVVVYLGAPVSEFVARPGTSKSLSFA
ncbi:hypothetical protein HWV62_29164 [Athelia sp. TMB]|nr:hypothetical protein HWV62_29164 [Athelia sp. TMB]